VVKVVEYHNMTNILITYVSKNIFVFLISFRNLSVAFHNFCNVSLKSQQYSISVGLKATMQIHAAWLELFHNFPNALQLISANKQCIYYLLHTMHKNA